jgi:uncharacterized protein Usg
VVRGSRVGCCGASATNRSLDPRDSDRIIVGQGDVMVSRDFLLQLEGYGLTTAEIHYRLPDHPALLQLYVWQDYDLAPAFPTLQGFLDHWQRELEGALHSVRVAHRRLIHPSEWRAVDGIIRVH